MAIVIVLWLGGREVLRHRISLGSFVAFNTYMVQLTWPMIALGWVINIVPARHRIHGAHSVRSWRRSPRSPTPACRRSDVPTEIRGDIEFRNLSFTYGDTLLAAESDPSKPPKEKVLDGINLRVPAGTSLAIVGPTGSGKSTLVS